MNRDNVKFKASKNIIALLNLLWRIERKVLHGNFKKTELLKALYIKVNLQCNP